MSVTLDRASVEPLVRQLHRALRDLILVGRLAPGARLPSTRKLSRDLQVSRTVTLDAFAQLGAEGFLESLHGSGHFVASLRLPAADLQPRPALPKAEAEPSVWSAHGRPFDPAWQAVDVFPSQLWSRMLGRGWRRHQSEAIERHWAGLPVLREALASHLHALRGVPLSADEIFITSGNNDAMSLIARSIGRGATAWVEDPAYAATTRIFEREKLRVVRVPVDAEGLDVAAGERLAPDAALALVTATRQFPLGMPLSLNRRLALLDWARRSGADHRGRRFRRRDSLRRAAPAIAGQPRPSGARADGRQLLQGNLPWPAARLCCRICGVDRPPGRCPPQLPGAGANGRPGGARRIHRNRGVRAAPEAAADLSDAAAADSRRMPSARFCRLARGPGSAGRHAADRPALRYA